MSEAAEDAPAPGEVQEERRRLTATLTGLRIAGFKSFAEPVQVPVLPGLTGIVGPNGCGKSNVVEALRWAMGESSARSLRGGEMDDVIFAGTATRPARNLAEVVLRLEDALGVGPSPHHEASELEVIRRIERGSGSSYRLNGRELRQRDVQTMFADLASGPRASGMVSQGRVAALIGAKPEERRAVLEEAAGIAGLRQRRHEAELKLRQAEANLARSEDLLAQLGQQGDSLRRQARQASRYRNLNDLVRGAEAEWFALLVARAEAAIAGAKARLEERGAALALAERSAAEAARQAEAAEAALHAPRAEEGLARTLLERRRVEAEGLQAEAERAQAALAEAEAALAQLRADAADATVLEEDAAAAGTRAQREEAGLLGALAQLPARIEAAETLATELAEATAAEQARLEEATEAAAALAARANGLAAELAFAEGRAQRAGRQRQEAEAARAEAEAQAVPEAALAEAADAVLTAERTLAESRAALEEAERRRAAAAEAAAALGREARAAEMERAAAERARAGAAGRHATVVQRAGALEADAARLPRAEPPEPLETAAAEAAKALRDAEARLVAAGTAREVALREARAAREAAEAARAALARLAAECEGLRAATAAGAEADPIAATLTIPEGLEAALGAALGEGLEGGRGQGRRFWRSLPPLEAPPPLPQGAVGLGGLVGAPPELARALSQVGLAEDGAPLQAQLRPGQAIVSRAGALWRWDGYVLAPGAAAAGAARLQALARLRQAEAKRDAAAPEAARAEAARDATQAAERAAIAAEDAARGARGAAERAEREAAARAGEARARWDAAARRRAEHEAAVARLAAERAEAEAALAEAEALLRAAPARPDLHGATEAADRATGEEREARGRRGEAEAALARARAGEAALWARAGAAAAQLAALQPQLARLAEEAAEAEASLAQARAARAALPDLGGARAQVEAARLALAATRAREAEARGAAGALRAEREGLLARRESAAAERAAWATRLAEARSRRAALDTRTEEARRRQEALARAPEAVTARAEAAARAVAAAEAAHEAARAALEAAEARARSGAEARRAADAALGGAREARLLAEAAQEGALREGQSLATRILERLGEDASLPEPPADLSDAAEERARRRAERLAREREEMGPVNLRAEVELAELEARVAAIHTDREEIAAAIAKLRGSIGHLNREARERLRAIFDRVDREFRALFARLFGGGRAHLALVGSEDPLEAGLEIYAEPPGKKLAALSLLSGGEQALTALSLIFAVFRCHPAPVCVLDEVDAPLDDANVERLCDLLDMMSQPAAGGTAETGTRFLVITHHALTMARMHRLFGVTMQERGVSRLLSVDLGEAVRMAEG